MRFGLAQIDCVVGDRAANRATIRRLAKKAQQEHCAVVIYPEICDMGYDLPLVAAAAATTKPEPLSALQAIARETGLYLVAGIADARDGKVFNSTIVVSPQGEKIAQYDKTHLVTVAPLHEERYITAGDKFVTTMIGEFTCGFMTCYDLRFPEVARTLMLRGANVIILPAAWPQVRLSHWETLARARAIENQAYVLACNRVGEDVPGIVFAGTSLAIDPSGRVLQKGSFDQEELLIADISLEVIKLTRHSMNVLQDRRPEIYQEFCK